MSECAIQLEQDLTQDKTYVNLHCRIAIDHTKLRRADASYADLLYNELRLTFDVAWNDALVTLHRVVHHV